MGLRSAVVLATVLSFGLQMYEYTTKDEEDYPGVVQRRASPFIELIWTCGIVLLAEKFELKFLGIPNGFYQFSIDLVLSSFILTVIRPLLLKYTIQYLFVELMPTLIFPILKNITGLEEETIEKCYVGFIATIGCIFLIYMFSRDKTICELDLGFGEGVRPPTPRMVREDWQGQGDADPSYRSPSTIHEEEQDDMELRQMYGPPQTYPPGRRQGIPRYQTPLRRSQRRRTLTPSPEL